MYQHCELEPNGRFICVQDLGSFPLVTKNAPSKPTVPSALADAGVPTAVPDASIPAVPDASIPADADADVDADADADAGPDAAR